MNFRMFNPVKSNDCADNSKQRAAEEGNEPNYHKFIYALKLSPQEQLVAALGFFTLKPPSCNASM